MEPRALQREMEFCFQLAKKIEHVVLWQPGKEAGSALTGTPVDPRYEYVHTD